MDVCVDGWTDGCAPHTNGQMGCELMHHQRKPPPPPPQRHATPQRHARTHAQFGLDLYSMATLGQSLVVPVLASLQIAENNIFAPIILKERLNKVREQ